MTTTPQDSAPPHTPPKETYTLCLSDGNHFGPATLNLIAQWARERRLPIDAVLLPADGSDPRSVLAFPELATILNTPPTVGGPLISPAVPESTTSKVIPYRNPPALTAYYLAIFSLLTGPVPGIPAIILGIIGLRKRARNHSIHGSAHAWIGIILGFLTTASCATCFFFLLLSR